MCDHVHYNYECPKSVHKTILYCVCEAWFSYGEESEQSHTPK